MPRIRQPLIREGTAIIRVLVDVPVARERVFPLFPAGNQLPLWLELQIDCGATITCLDRQAVEALDLHSNEVRTVRSRFHNHQTVNVPTYDVSMRLPSNEGNYHVATMPVLLDDFAGEGIHGLLGCDLLAACLFSYHGPGKHYTLEFPTRYVE